MYNEVLHDKFFKIAFITDIIGKGKVAPHKDYFMIYDVKTENNINL